MFLTTIRVRRARPVTLDAHLTLPVLEDLRARRAPVLEVMAHGKPVALTGADVVLWKHDAIADYSDDRLLELVDAAGALMGRVHGTAITAGGPEAPEGSPPRTLPSRRQRRPVVA